MKEIPTATTAEHGDAAPAATILVVDDAEANRLLAQHTLVDEGYRVVLASGGLEALAAFDRERVDCVILDVRMPDLDGFAVCKRIRTMPGGDAPVIFLTALRDVETFDRALEAGGDDFLTKPVQTAELVVRVQTALKLRQLNTDLHEQYEAIKRQRDDLMRLQLQKERLMAFVIHDLKNPVNSMDLHAQVLLRDGDLSESAREAATHIRTEARQLSRLIMNLLDISKADEGRLCSKPEPIDLAAMVEEILLELQPVAHTRSVSIRSELASVRLTADPDLLRRTLVNLAENALRHAPKGSAVTLESRRDGDHVELRICDAGAGVPPEMREKVFEAFVQLEGGTRPETRAGRGLGLTFCKLAVEAHGGRIWLEDANPGACFCVRLPA